MSNYEKKIKSLNDIKSGYVCKLRNGKLYMCMRENQEEFNKVLANQETDIAGSCYDNLDYRFCSSNDIIEVYGLANRFHSDPYEISTYGRPLLYKRPEAKELTVKQISDLLGYEVKVVSSK